jgi:hypothetical protein
MYTAFVGIQALYTLDCIYTHRSLVLYKCSPFRDYKTKNIMSEFAGFAPEPIFTYLGPHCRCSTPATIQPLLCVAVCHDTQV